ncbi:MAG: hypothetical protein ACRECD_16030 [Burkholderiaceae bacterium]
MTNITEVAERLLYLRLRTKYKNEYAVEIETHPELGSLAMQEACANFVVEHGAAIAAALEQPTASDKMPAASEQEPAGSEQESVYLVATGETHNGLETYARHEKRPPMCDAEKLYTTPPQNKPQPDEWAEALAKSISSALRSEIISMGKLAFRSHCKGGMSNFAELAAQLRDSGMLRGRGHAVKGDLTKIYRSKA